MIWEGRQWGHRWAANLCREEGTTPAQGDAAAPSRWFIPAAEWSNDVLLAPGGKAMFPCGIGRLHFAVWCAPAQSWLVTSTLPTQLLSPRQA